MSQWYGKGGDWINTGLPHYIAIKRKPENGCEIQVQLLPPIVRYCQRYQVGPYRFSKYELPRRFLSCNQPLFQDPVVAANKDGNIAATAAMMVTSTSYDDIE
jgi:hypothetical protein